MFKSVLDTTGRDNTGTWVMREGKLVKVSDSASVGDIWIKKHRIDGRKDLKEFYAQEERKGTLGKVNDREVWEELR